MNCCSRMFIRFLQRNHKRFPDIAGSGRAGETPEPARKINRGIVIVGQGILDPEGEAEEEIINEVNGVETDCILSILPSPQQEEFIVKNSALLNARMWLGCGKTLSRMYGERSGSGVRRFFLKKIFRYRVGRQRKEV